MSISLKDVIKPEVIKLKENAKDCFDAIKISGKILAEQGIVEDKYIDAMIRTFQEFGSYIVIAPGVAIPHARPEDGAKRVGLAIVTFKDPIKFGNPENDPVKICIAFASPNKTQHVKILAAIAKLLQHKEDIDAIANAENPKEVIEILQKYEKNIRESF
jgi:mannitol/fructose-specific phosphotransferase system IIA component (Ntr-type)